VDKDECVVCIATGHVLKDPEEAIEVSERPREVPATYEDVLRELG
jgi:threonine synthase